MKTCTKCGQEKALDAFHKDARKPDGRVSSCKECCAAFYRENRERKAAYNRENRERIAEREAKYRRENPDVAARNTAKRRALKANASHEPYSRAEIFARWSGQCCYCDAPAEHLDHVHPLSKGGADAPHNLVPACAPCNLTKSAKPLAEWAETF